MLTTPKPAQRTPERLPGRHDGSSGATATLPLNASMAIDDGSDYEGPPLSQQRLRFYGGGRRLRVTIRRRSESRQTKKNRVRKPRMIDVRV